MKSSTTSRSVEISLPTEFKPDEEIAFSWNAGLNVFKKTHVNMPWQRQYFKKR